MWERDKKHLQKNTANIILNGERLNAFHLRLETEWKGERVRERDWLTYWLWRFSSPKFADYVGSRLVTHGRVDVAACVWGLSSGQTPSF